jgi:hypothetical protein
MPIDKGREFAALLEAEAARAEAVAEGAIEGWFAIGGLTMRLRFLGSSLVPVIAPAFAHLEIAPRDHAHLTLECWDCAALGLELPSAPVPMAAFTARGELQGLGAGVHAAFEPWGRQLSLFDAARRRAFFCVGNGAEIRRWERAEPVRAILSWFMREYGRQLVHAAAVGNADGGVLLLGRSGAGKSNTALGVLKSSLAFAADDFCAISAEPVPTAYSLYCTAKTIEGDWKRHPFLKSLNPDLDMFGDKTIYYLAETVPEKLIAEFPIKALLLLRHGGNACHAVPASPNAALAAVAPDTARLLPGAGPEVLHKVGKMVRRLPCFDFFLGPDPKRIPDAIEALMTRLDAERLEPA